MTRGRPPLIPAEKRPRIVMAILSGEVPIAKAARREKVSEQSIGLWGGIPRGVKTALISRR